MPLVDPPYPSFTLVVTKMYPSSPRPFDSSRLPAYRAAHVGRFHPYPRGPRRNTEANYTPTVDYSPPLETIVEEPEAVEIRRLTVYYDEEEDSINSELSYELAEPLAGEWYPAEDVTVPGLRPIVFLTNLSFRDEVCCIYAAVYTLAVLYSYRDVSTSHDPTRTFYRYTQKSIVLGSNCAIHLGADDIAPTNLDTEQDDRLEVVLLKKRGHRRYCHGECGLVIYAEQEVPERRSIELGRCGAECCGPQDATVGSPAEFLGRTSRVLFRDNDRNIQDLSEAQRRDTVYTMDMAAGEGLTSHRNGDRAADHGHSEVEFCEAEAEQKRTLANLSILALVATTWSKPWMRGPDSDRGQTGINGAGADARKRVWLPSHPHPPPDPLILPGLRRGPVLRLSPTLRHGTVSPFVKPLKNPYMFKMDHDSHFQDGVDAERMRMSSFSFGKPVSPSGANLPSRHSRSHSRNSSVSVPPSLPTSVSTPSMNDSRSQSPTRNSISGAKRNSHHRRRSSVSTRRESADLMGVSLPSIPISSSEDNINLGDKDSIRRRALWALEGKDARGTFSVEIPELDVPEAPKRSFDFPTKPSFPPGIGAGYNGGLSTLMGSKRDSIKFMPSACSSEMLGTLVEEEEEEEEEETTVVATSPERHASVPTTMTAVQPAPVRPRPASLNLRPLSLSSNSLFQDDILTPSPTPSPRLGLKSLTLTSSPSSTLGSAIDRRQSVILSSSPSAPVPLNRRPPLNVMTDNAVSVSPSRRSSITYVTNADAQTVSVWGLPTPDMTPTSSTLDKRRTTSISSSASGSMDLGQLNMPRGRPLSMSEQHFLFQAHETLVQRITDLERALAHSSRSRPVSCASDASYASSEPSDEMLQLIADLKAERDELKKDVDGWRTRVADLQHQIDMHAKRIETERRDAWVARQRVGLLEVEKSALEKTTAEKTAQAEDVIARLAASDASVRSSQNEVTHLKAEVERLRNVEDECARLRAGLLAERKKREEMERDLEHAGLLDTPRPFNAISNGVPVARVMVHAKRGLGFRSIDSESSFTDVDSGDEDHRPGLKAVQEVDEGDSEATSDDEDELARYEDEEEGDEYEFPTSASYESVMEYSRATTPRLSTDSANSAPSLCTSRSPSVSPSPLPSPMEPMPPTPVSSHVRHASLSKAWTFPTTVPAAERRFEEIDHFFGCLEDVDNSPPMDSKLHSIESNKNIFAQALVEDDDDLPPFVLPSDVGNVVVSPEVDAPRHSLGIVVEEDEEDDDEEEEDAQRYDDYDIDEEFVGEVDEGGIKFTFNPPPEYFLDSDADTSTSTSDLSFTSPTSPSFQFANKSDNIFEPIDDSEEDASFTFPQLKPQRSSTLPSAIPRLRSPSPSMLPLPVSSSTPPKIVAPVPRRATMSPTSFSTPPLKRSATAPTFIPQPRGPPSTPSKLPKAASFVPQPQRAPASPKPSAIPVMTSPASTGTASRSPSVTPRPTSTASDMKTSYASIQPQLTSPPSLSSAPAPYSPSLPSFMSPTFSARLSFQTLTNFVPSMLWSSRSGDGSDDSTTSTPTTASAADHSRADSTFVNAIIPPARKAEVPKERTYVPKEKQLERLRLRMEEERKRGRPTGTSLGVQAKKSQAGVLDI
ncbi:hypothetical protein GSI_00358 [Ganoderma sinense ZZ0214-1]|uniref:Uncharacterized protein n=1 Tax=Ganoderma sinense ZZ0214-1 TaxID=1077348 RepID=A0A2G8SSC1_9APHY|nr:hypothetical protein GSI_00358 [Ganoderma sinense ZZ0214-1]